MGAVRIPSTFLALLAIALVAGACSASTTLGEGSRTERQVSTAGLDDDGSDDAGEAASTGVTDEAGASDDADEAAQADALPSLFDEGAFSEGLVDDCVAFDDRACDILYQVSRFDSPEEAIALDCGGREPSVDFFCTAGINPDGENLWFDPDSPALSGIVEDCVDGDMTACDFLYFRSPVNSRFEVIGQTCADRTEELTVDCRTQFPAG